MYSYVGKRMDAKDVRGVLQHNFTEGIRCGFANWDVGLLVFWNNGHDEH